MKMKELLGQAQELFDGPGGEYPQGPFIRRAEWAANLAVTSHDDTSLLLLLAANPKLLESSASDHIDEYESPSVRKLLTEVLIAHVASVLWKKYSRRARVAAVEKQTPPPPVLPAVIRLWLQDENVKLDAFFGEGAGPPAYTMNYNLATKEDNLLFASWLLEHLRNPRWVREQLGVG